MEVRIMHREHFHFGWGDIDWEALALGPIGLVKDDEGSWFPLALDEKRQAYLVDATGPHPLDRESVGPAIYSALDAECERLWGHTWNSAIGDIFALNRRTTQRDRVSRYLLPPPILQVIAYVASADDGPELAIALLALSRYAARTKSRDETLRYWDNAAKIFFGEADIVVGAGALARPIDGGVKK